MPDLTLLLAPTLGALAAGAATAQVSAPLATRWRARNGAMKRRLLAIATPVRLPGPGRRLAGAAALAATLTTGGLAGYAAQPSAPERLAAQAGGVVGSGDQLALRVKEDSQERTIKPGDDYADGWKLQALTPTKATLTKDGVSREVGLNPTGALANNAPAAPPSQVWVTQSDDELADRVIRNGVWDGKTARPNLTLDETRRYNVLRMKGMLGTLTYFPAMNEEAKCAGYPGANAIIESDKQTEDITIALLGAEAPEHVALLNKETPSKQLSIDDIKPVDEVALFRIPGVGQFVSPSFWRQPKP